MDLRFLRELTDKPGPFATVYLDASHDTDDAARALALRWAEARASLAEQGADAATLDALAAAVDAAPPAVGRAGRVLVARGGEVVLDRTLPEPPQRPTCRWGPLPDLLPVLVEQPEPVTAVVVRVDETGGEVFVAGPDAGPDRVEDVQGSEYLVHKVRGGGWSHLAMQERVEESWRRNTAEVAERVDRHVSATGASVLVVAGEPRSRSRLVDALGERSASIAVQVDHSGGATGDDLAAAVAEAVQDVVTAHRRALLERYEQAAGRPDGLAVQGIRDVLAALRAEAVDTLLLDAGATRDTTVWISDAPAQVAEAAEDLRATGSEPTGEVAVDAALLRAAAGTGAGFVAIGGGRTGLVGHPLEDGVGALLRYPLPTGA
ncbi:Vms1/Ankzf1 family peptidyl-tRNA hydrolase [Pseudonocardia kunmingensis]|uniref:Peptide subunit release factor 1 (ERF1) n=1 Tax=Pseudonocardia kunmingensis TaxID=630975 RepID=A0A543D1B6_9PSEU|nr:Vms1/Ankzf1 family peptidyl-tRNA hydrolase [Pseudonocardia kunmingensis]TQM03127.1 hypothetical protein FB558_7777 [Pseudonocardia kunmingensis]